MNYYSKFLSMSKYDLAQEMKTDILFLCFANLLATVRT